MPQIQFTSYEGIKELETPYGRFTLYTWGWTDNLVAIKKELLIILGQEITHVNGKRIMVEELNWNMDIYEDELRKHVHLIYDPDHVLRDLNPKSLEYYHLVKSNYLIKLQKFDKYKEPGLYALQMLDSKHIYKHLIGLSVELYNRI